MRPVLALGALALGFNAFVAAAEQPPPLPKAPPKDAACTNCALKDKPAATLEKGKPAVAPAPSLLEKQSTAFWGDWKTTQQSQSFTALMTAVAGAQAMRANLTTGIPGLPGVHLNGQPQKPTQLIVDVAVTKPEAAAKLLSAASSASSDQAGTAALATVVTMTASPKTLEAAAPLVAPDAQAMTANLSTGIPGLPGIYLSDQPIESGGGGGGGGRAEAPAGYAPVSGGSMGCPAGS